MTIIKTINIKQLIYAILIIMWMAVVFAFSNESATRSSLTSGSITERVVKIITKEPENLTQTQRDQIETIVRKTAHFTLYSIGGFLMAGFIATTNTKIKTSTLFLYAVAFTTLYACTDEIHQRFVDGRSCELRDVCIDGAGAMLGAGVFLIVRKSIDRIKKK